MRRLLLLVSVLLLGTCWVVAQDTSPSGNANSPSTSGSNQNTGQSTTANPNQNSEATSTGQTDSSRSGEHMTVEGCLSGSSGNYTLTDKNGMTYQLTGDTAKLNEHVGHEVKVTGTSGAGSASAGAGSASASGGTATGSTGAAGGNSQTLEVTSVKHVSKTCQTGSGMAK